jgi:hypothetical protein
VTTTPARYAYNARSLAAVRQEPEVPARTAERPLGRFLRPARIDASCAAQQTAKSEAADPY